MGNPQTDHLRLEGIGKSYGPLRALEGINLSITAGTVHALVGENGAGKSTLGSIISGRTGPDEGRILLYGRPVSFASPRAALDHGVAAVAQELVIVDALSVAENVFLGREPKLCGVVQRKRLNRRYDELAATAGFNLSGRRLAGTLQAAEKQQVEILRALSRDAGFIIMDEPSASLSGPQNAALHAIIRSLSASGRTVLLVSHFLDEVLELADEITVLRDGHLVRTAPAKNETKDSLIRAMLGRSLGAAYPPKRAASSEAETVLSVRHLYAPGVVDASFEVRSGEIVGLAGLVGAGRTELARALCGAERRSSGEVSMQGTGALARSPLGTLRAGLVMIPESRKEEGLLPGRSVTENVTIADLRSFSTLGVVRRSREETASGSLLDRVGVRRTAASLPAMALSGGNQQKVLFARALLCHPRLLIADEPTRGVDIGAKRAIYELIGEMAADGAGVLFISSELEEVLEVAHRVLVLRSGRIVASLGPDELTEQKVLSAAFSEPAATIDHQQGGYE